MISFLPRAVKIKRILCSDWLPSGQDGFFTRSGFLTLVPRPGRKSPLCGSMLFQYLLLIIILFFCFIELYPVSELERAVTGSPTLDLATLPQVRKISTLKIDIFTVFSTFDMDTLRKIRRHHWKERLNIGKTAKFENDMS